jgi:hypothetical protein
MSCHGHARVPWHALGHGRCLKIDGRITPSQAGSKAKSMHLPVRRMDMCALRRAHPRDQQSELLSSSSCEAPVFTWMPVDIDAVLEIDGNRSSAGIFSPPPPSLCLPPLPSSLHSLCSVPFATTTKNLPSCTAV